ncbi:hypothetical protein A6E15_03020 [Natrinema saccharevitans]|uniref:Uncharacterized protein n=1 Tax=Natrinema saccharevitans TaxID=301967 RepID=A0A1S8ATJ9_9EURY|nr:hypothetical protein [Natrinema saccharevitans]OLZ40012.1 hypothetical protein A6E15_03020 [Natrinema saccharevitans]
MIDLDWETDRIDGVTLVSATIEIAATTPQRVRLESRLEGPVWPPTDGDRPAAWTDAAWEGVIDPDRRHGIGFASPASPVEPPLAVTDHRRVSSDRSPRPAAVLASLTGWKPTSTVVGRER